jgi:hypothetical protein
VVLFAVTVGSLLASSVAPAAPAPGAVAEGTITALGAGTLTLTTRDGTQVRIAVTGDTRIIQRKAVKLEDIKPNEFVGVTARREADGSLTAISINIFPPEFRDRIREAQFVMDTGNVMTNATVFQNVRRIEGRTLYLRLADGTAVITVPREAEVFRLTVIQFGVLRMGMRVQARGANAPEGWMTATTITVDAP